MYIEQLHRTLIEVARQRIRAGQLTERGLARMCGTSQPHIHNVLKQIRALSTASADRLMHALQLSVPELIWRFPGESEPGVQAIPVLRDRIGPGAEGNLTLFGGYMPFPATLVEGIVEPIAARLGADLVLPSSVAINDLVLLDQNPRLRERPAGRNCWVVSEGRGLRVRYVSISGDTLYFANQAVHDSQSRQSISLRGRSILDLVRARIVWIGREMEASAPGSSDSSCAGD